MRAVGALEVRHRVERHEPRDRAAAHHLGDARVARLQVELDRGVGVRRRAPPPPAGRSRHPRSRPAPRRCARGPRRPRQRPPMTRSPKSRQISAPAGASSLARPALQRVAHRREIAAAVAGGAQRASRRRLEGREHARGVVFIEARVHARPAARPAVVAACVSQVCAWRRRLPRDDAREAQPACREVLARARPTAASRAAVTES